MILLQSQSGKEFALAAFGAGLIGASVVEAVRRHRTVTTTHMAFEWADVAARTQQLVAIESALKRIVTAGTPLDILWSAGRAGFLSGASEADAELASFTQVVKMTERLSGQIRFHLVSSAGALFESQRSVDATSTPLPKRAYGHLKLRQEEMLAASAHQIVHIYRVSSVYGYVRPQFRAGLATTLVRDGMQRAVTRLTGRMTTLRDFVFIDDVASYLADRMNAPAAGPSVSFLVSARPYSLLEVESVVEQVLGRKLYVSYSGDENADDITFTPAIAPVGWHASDLRANIGIIYRDALSGPGVTTRT